jgi:peptidoglycan/LPS O-acetylase OafA/YrhL
VPWDGYVDAGLPLRLGFVLLLVPWILGAAAILHHLVEEPARRFLLAWSAR